MQRKIEYFQTEAGERDEWRVCNKGPVSSLAWPGPGNEGEAGAGRQI